MTRLPADWPDCILDVRPALERMAAGSGGRYLVADIETALDEGRMQVWATPDCVLVTELCDYPRFRALRCIGLVGRRPRRWLGLLAEIEAAARAWGCARIEAFGPAGTERMLGTGWSVFHTLWEKAL